jgi:hypothetical protein
MLHVVELVSTHHLPCRDMLALFENLFEHVTWKNAPKAFIMSDYHDLLLPLLKMAKNGVVSHARIIAAVQCCHERRPCIFSPKGVESAACKISSHLRALLSKFRSCKRDPAASRVLLLRANPWQKRAIEECLELLQVDTSEVAPLALEDLPGAVPIRTTVSTEIRVKVDCGMGMGMDEDGWPKFAEIDEALLEDDPEVATPKAAAAVAGHSSASFFGASTPMFGASSSCDATIQLTVSPPNDRDDLIHAAAAEPVPANRNACLARARAAKLQKTPAKPARRANALQQASGVKVKKEATLKSTLKCVHSRAYHQARSRLLKQGLDADSAAEGAREAAHAAVAEFKQQGE